MGQGGEGRAGVNDCTSQGCLFSQTPLTCFLFTADTHKQDNYKTDRRQAMSYEMKQLGRKTEYTESEQEAQQGTTPKDRHLLITTSTICSYRHPNTVTEIKKSRNQETTEGCNELAR